MNKLFQKIFSSKNLDILSLFIIIIGVVLRTICYLQNRCLFIDEANVARNIYERGFIALTHPLSYEQYAPPLFLWAVKISTLIFGYSELSFRLCSFISGIAALWLLRRALTKYTDHTSVWYPIFIFATGFIYIRYATELKQYMVDVVVILILLLSAIRFSIASMRRVQFVIIWSVLGSVAIWLSMPSVFMLSGVGIWYCYGCLSHKQYTSFISLAVISAIWLLQFAFYYHIILSPQIQSDFLQNCHKDFFLYPLPSSAAQWNHNTDVLTKVLAAMGGKWAISISFHLLTIGTGIVYLFRTQKDKLLLTATPILFVIIGAAANQYALTPRLVLFIMPLLLILVAVGLQQLLKVRYVAIRVALVIAGLICIVNFSTFDLLYKRHDNEQITESMSFLQQQHITAAHLFVRDLAGPAYIYYTTIHPSRDKWHDLAGAPVLNWNTNFDSLAQSFSGTNALLYSWAPEDEINNEQNAMNKNFRLIAQHQVVGGLVFIYTR